MHKCNKLRICILTVMVCCFWPIVLQSATSAADKPSSTDSAGSVDVNSQPYLADVKSRIQKVWSPPKGEEFKRVLVSFKVHSFGIITDLHVQVTSGSASADHAALAAVQDAAPFSPLPSGFPESIDVQFTFDYSLLPTS